MGTGPALALEWKDAGEVWIAIEERDEIGVQPPVDFAFGQVPLEQTQNRQSLDDVTQRARFENEYLQLLADG